MQGISIIICCYNSAPRIEETLWHLSLQKTEASLTWEIIVVDNASTDNTAQVTLDYWRSLNSPIQLSIINEPRPGLTHARNTGIKSSAFDVIVFCDDDNWLSKNYIQTAFNKMTSHSDAGIIGGWCEGKYEIPIKPWLKPMQSALAIGPPTHKGALSKWQSTVNGAGMVLNKKAYQKLIFFRFNSQLLGRKSNALMAGEDSELCFAMFFVGYEVYLFEDLYFIHFMPKKRLATKYFFKLTLDHVTHLIVLRMYPIVFSEPNQSFFKFLVFFSLRKIGEMIYVFPRMIIGKSRFRSLIQFLQSIKMLFVICVRYSEFKMTYQEIRNFKNRCQQGDNL